MRSFSYKLTERRSAWSEHIFTTTFYISLRYSRTKSKNHTNTKHTHMVRRLYYITVFEFCLWLLVVVVLGPPKISRRQSLNAINLATTHGINIAWDRAYIDRSDLEENLHRKAVWIIMELIRPHFQMLYSFFILLLQQTY